MGNGSSSRRNWRAQQNSAHPRSHAAPTGYVPYYHRGAHAHHQNGEVISQVRLQYYPSNGQLFMGMPSGNFGRVVPPIPPSPASPSSVHLVAEHQKVSTISNDVNVKKTTVHLEKDEGNPGFYLIAFTFDAIVPGSICIFFHAKEGNEFSLVPLKPHLFTPIKVSFEKGLGQKFRQASGTGVNLSMFEPSDLMEVTEGEIFPLMVRTETLPKDSSTNVAKQSDIIGAPLPKWVNAQTTHCVIEMKDDDYCVKVVKQTIWVDGVRYELQEIYGIENADGEGGFDSSDSGKECVICLSEQRDTTVLPCRHMCMCSACANVLRLQTNRCPICRTPVEKLLEIKVPKQEAKQSVDVV